MRRGARLVNALMAKPPDKTELHRAVAGGDLEGIARALAVAVIMLSGTAGYTHEGLTAELQRMVWEYERLERQRTR